MSNYNPLNYRPDLNSWTAVDDFLSGGQTRRTYISSIVSSGSNLFFSGRFIFNYSNVYNVTYFSLPDDSLQYINVAYFDTTTNRFKKLANIGRAYQVDLDNDTGDKVYSLALCGQNLIAGGRFNLINTAITGYQSSNSYSQSQFYTISNYPPFSSGITALQVIPVTAYNLLFTDIWTQGYAPTFTPTFSGNYCNSHAYYNPRVKKWEAFPNSTNLNFANVVTTAVSEYNNLAFIAGTYDSGTLMYNQDGKWNMVNPSFTTALYTSPYPCYSLYNDGQGNLLYCGAVERYGGDVNATGILKYNGTSLSAIGTGLSGTWPYATAVVLSGDSYIAVGPFNDFISYYNKYDTVKTWKRLYSGTPASKNFTAGVDSILSLSLSGSNLVFTGSFSGAGNLTGATEVGYLTPTYTFGSLNGEIEKDMYLASPPDGPGWGAIRGRVIYANVPVPYSANNGTTIDVGSINLFTNREFIDAGAGVTVYGNSPYQGVSGVYISI